MNLFSQRKNKRFKYTPRHLTDADSSIKQNLESHWRGSRKVGTTGNKKASKLLILIVVLGMIIALWYVLNNYKL